MQNPISRVVVGIEAAVLCLPLTLLFLYLTFVQYTSEFHTVGLFESPVLEIAGNAAILLALYAACEEMGIIPVVITSLGASNWGANHPDYTWLDMEKTLYEANLISRISVAASLGGGTDNGRGLSVQGRKLLLDNIEKNNVELIFSGKMISAEEAKQMGIVNQIHEAESLMEAVQKTAKMIAAKGKTSLRAAKEVINRGMDVDLHTGCHMEIDAFSLCMASEDAKEGTHAFLEKRKAVFTGSLVG